jgi:anti-sigma factor RsiW
MNPCRKNKRRIAWMATGVLETADAERLREHLETCPGCRHHWENMCALSERLKAAELPDVEPTGSFHRRVLQKIREEEKAAPLFAWDAALRRLWGERRLATLAVGGALGIATLLWMQSFRPEDRGSARVHIEETTETARSAPLPSTLGSYRRAGDISFENLDAVLTRQIATKSSRVETFTVSSSLARSFED